MKKEKLEFSFDFIEIMTKTTEENMMVEVKNEFILDCRNMKNIYDSGIYTNEALIELMLCYFSKYSFIIYFFEKKERYEDCVEVTKMFKVFISVYFEVEPNETKKLINESVEFYRSIVEL